MVISVPLITTSQQFTDQPTANTGVLRDGSGGVTHANVTAQKNLTCGGAEFITPTTVAAGYAISATDSVIYANATTGAFNVTLPTPSSNLGRIIRVKKIDSSANAVTILHNSTELIDGASNYSLPTQYTHVTLMCDGTNWNVF